MGVATGKPRPSLRSGRATRPHLQPAFTIIRHYWEQNCYKVMLLTGRRDEATLRFYQQAGFEAGVKTGFVARR
jgi:hypothetical protein